MALPVAHVALATGLTRVSRLRFLITVAIISVAPDFDFILVWGLGFSRQEFHRTFSHSFCFGLLAAGAWGWLRPSSLKPIGARLFAIIWTSHVVLDLLCTLDVADHGLTVFWPFSQSRFGWAVLVPIYQLAADSPFSWQGMLAFTLLEMALAYPLWKLGTWIGTLLRIRLP